MNRRLFALMLSILMVISMVPVQAFADDSVIEPQDAIVDTVEEPSEEPSEEATEEATEDATEDATEETTEEATEDATEETTEEATEETTEETTEATEEVFEEEEAITASEEAEMDADAEPVAMIGETAYATLAEAVAAAEAGDIIELTADTAETGITVAADQELTIEMNGYTLTGDIMSYGVLTVQNGTIVNTAFVSGIESNGAAADLTVINMVITSDRQALRIDGGKATIVSGTYTSTVDGSSCYAVNMGGDVATTVVIKDGTFIASPKAATQGPAVMAKNDLCDLTINGGTFVTGQIHSVESYGTTTITGGTFQGSLVLEDAVISGGTFTQDLSTWVADGYTVQQSGDVYKVIPFPVKMGEATYATLADAVAAVGTEAATIELAAGTYSIPGAGTMNNKNITFKGTKDAIIDMATVGAANGATITFDGVTVQFPNKNYTGLQHAAKVVYKDCAITGKQFLYAEVVEFTNCTLTNLADYSVWTYGAQNVTFTDCTFYSGGKAVLVYNEKTTEGFVANITLNNCVFHDDDSLDTVKAAVETGSNADNTETSNKYVLTFNNCEVNGFAENDEGTPTGSTLWGNKNAMDFGHLKVTVDGVLKTYSIKIGATAYATLADAVAAVGTEAATIELAAGTYSIPDAGMNNKNITFKGTKDAIIDMATVGAANGATITFEGVTVQFPNKNYTGLQHAAKVVYKDCAITGKQFLYAEVVEFTNCTLTNLADYSVWTYGAQNVTFTDCTFYSGGKAVLVYVEKELHATIKAENCAFYDDNTLTTTKAAIEVGASSKSEDTTYSLILNNCTVEGFAENDEGMATGTTLWGNKNAMDFDHLAVTVDGELKTVAQVLVGDAQFLTVANAIAAAEAGDTVTVVKSTSESFTIDKAITLACAEGVTLTPAEPIKVTASGVTFENVNLNWATPADIEFDYTGGLIVSAEGTHGGTAVESFSIIGGSYQRDFLPQKGYWVNSISAADLTITGASFLGGVQVYGNETLAMTGNTIAVVDAGQTSVGVSVLNETENATELAEYIYANNVISLDTTVYADVPNYFVQINWSEAVKQLAPAVSSITVSAETNVVNMGTTPTLSVAFTPVYAKADVTWKSSNEKIAKVENGTIIPVKAGTVTITASVATPSGTVTDTVKLTVVQPIEGISLNEQDTVLGVGKSVTFKSTLAPATTTEKDVVWSISADGAEVTTAKNGTMTLTKDGVDVATLTKGGKLTAKDVEDPITVTVTVTSAATNLEGNTVSASCNVKLHPLVKKVALSGIPTDKAIIIGAEETTLTATATAATATVETQFIWKSSSEKIAKVENGTITPVAPGTVTITATADDGSNKKDSVKLTIVQPIESISLGEDTAVLGVGKSVTFKSTLAPSNTTEKDVVWSISADGAEVTTAKNGIMTLTKDGVTIATLTKGGKLTAKDVEDPIDVTVTVTSAATNLEGNTVSDSCVVTLHPLVKKVALSNIPTDETVIIGASEATTLTAAATAATATVETQFIWKSSSEKIAKVENGTIIPVAPGTVTITATADDGSNKKDSVKLTIVQPIESISLGQDTVLGIGKSATFKSTLAPSNTTEKDVTWSIAADGAEVTTAKNGTMTLAKDGVTIATLTKAGKLTVDKKLEVTEPITVTVTVTSVATDLEGKTVSDSCEITLYPAVKKVTISGAPADKLVFIGDEATTLTASTGEGTANLVTWKSGNEKIAKVENGTIIPVKAGTVTITATAADGSGKKASVTLYIRQPVTDIAIDDSAVLTGGKSMTLKATVNDNATNKKLTWAIIPGEGQSVTEKSGTYTLKRDTVTIATLSSGGKLTAKKVTAMETVTVQVCAADNSGLAEAQTCTVTILPAVTTMTLKGFPTSKTLSVGSAAALSVDVAPTDASDSVTWKSSNTKIATVDANGVVTTLKAGSVTITATAADGSAKRVSVKLTVK